MTGVHSVGTLMPSPIDGTACLEATRHYDLSVLVTRTLSRRFGKGSRRISLCRLRRLSPVYSNHEESHVRRSSKLR